MHTIKATIIGLLLGAATLQAEAETINNASAGGLRDRIGERLAEISELTLTGPLNAEDIATLKWMATPDSGRLATIDLSHTQLLAIGDEAFGECANLKKVVLPPTVTQIGRSAFGGCKNLAELNIPDKVSHIGEYAFAECEKMTTFRIPQGVTTIPNGCFADCQALETVNLPRGTQELGREAFARCRNLKSIDIPAGTNAIGGAVFAGCESLSFIKVDPNNKRYCATAGGVLYSKDGKHILQYPAGKKDAVYTIPPGVVRVGNYCFSGNKFIKRITMPASCASVGYGAFYECGSLTQVQLPEQIEVIGSDMFYNCSSLDSVTIPARVTKINPNAFFGCARLKKLVLPAGLKTISKQCFHGCASIEDVIVPEGITEIPQSCFALCLNLKTISLPATLTTIGEMAFGGDTALASIKIPAGVREVGGGAFANCSALNNIEFPDSLKTIGFAAFVNCAKMEVLEIPAGVDSLGVSAIVGCDALKEIRLAGANPPKTNILANFNVSDSVQIIVPDGAEEKYHTALGWKEFRKINNKRYEVEHPDVDTDINDRLSLVGGQNMEEVFMVYSSIANEGSTAATQADNNIYEQSEVDEKATFAGGDAALLEYMKANISVPAGGRKGTVVLTVVVEKDGRLSHLKIDQSLGDDTDAEVVAAAYSMPGWTPAKKEGNPVRQRRIMKINTAK